MNRWASSIGSTSVVIMPISIGEFSACARIPHDEVTHERVAPNQANVGRTCSIAAAACRRPTDNVRPTFHANAVRLYG